MSTALAFPAAPDVFAATLAAAITPATGTAATPCRDVDDVLSQTVAPGALDA